MKIRVAFDGPEVSIIKWAERENVPNVDDLIRVEDPFDGGIYNGYVTARHFERDDEMAHDPDAVVCFLEVEQA
jgi:hypothetical protein